MSENKKNENIEEMVSSVNFFDLNNDIIERERIEENKEAHEEEKEENSIYEDFCNKYKYKDLESLELEELENIYKDGDVLLDLYYITIEEKAENELCKQTTIMQLQYIIGCVIYAIENKRYERNIEVSNKLTNVGNEIEKAKEEIKNIHNSVNNIITTVITIVLSVSVINSAIVGIDNIDPNYIIPFVSSVIFFGMIMILFIYSIYKSKIQAITIIILSLCFILSIFLWTCSIYKWTDITKKQTEITDNNTNQIVKNNIEEICSIQF